MDHVSRVGIFLEVARNESFAGAARNLGISSPAVSKQVQSLEDQLGVKLLNRTTRQVCLTEQGAIYAEKARKALEDLNEAEREILESKACPTGRLKINAPMSFGRQYLVKPIAQFAKQYPEIEMDVDFDDRWVDVIGEGYDVVVRIGALADSSLIARKIADCPICLCGSPAFLEKYGKPNSIENLSDFPAVLYTKQDHSQEWHYENSNGATGYTRLTRVFAANNAEMQLEACLQGIGMALVPVFAAAPYLGSGHLIKVMPDYQMSPQRGIYAVFPQNRHLSSKVRLFVDWLVEARQEFPWRDLPTGR